MKGTRGQKHSLVVTLILWFASVTIILAIQDHVWSASGHSRVLLVLTIIECLVAVSVSVFISLSRLVTTLTEGFDTAYAESQRYQQGVITYRKSFRHRLAKSRATSLKHMDDDLAIRQSHSFLANWVGLRR